MDKKFDDITKIFGCTIFGYNHNVKLVYDAVVHCFDVTNKILLHSTFGLKDTTQFKVNNRNIRKMGEICSKLTIKTPKRRH